MKIKENKDMLNALAKQRKEVASSKEAAKSLLVQLGIYNILIPKDSKSATTSPD
ncbi:hypothetical protein [Pedobacter psychroterrae]|uniref:hypothetical protein n=1 Tax=Pedobacter psychroterrae TaxID=2530453 RepID=UPI0013F16643|nr:hypothetical protein [Pedobacter psychroterrae]